MTTRSASFPLATERADAVAPARGWRLDARRAMSLRPKVPSVLSITQGRAWVTLGTAAKGAGNELGDHMLEAGQSLRVPAGARLVMEPWQPGVVEPVRFEWCTEPEARQATAPSRFRREVVHPSHELAVALGQAAWALARLARGLLGYTEYLVAGRGRVLTRFESNPP
ncbi:DUF2917 domain-containing protein [Hydrogenophaga sp.]|uniref:DUF2917 domain-containing protein n=1 Tax=Hydrogenophaga sp. TaxID=1904254 RepID=UPI00262178C6|nr:DUF2917 domain-containing protein [Hydrogenophaga sp.]MCW5654215.1 DUF2917 domain-containing protein [Hydrogenophaga sp.]